jgi:hypothetical protein
VLAGIRKVYFAIKSAIFTSLTKVKNSILEVMRGIGDTITKFFKAITSPFTNTYASFKKYANSLRTTFAQGMRAVHVSLADLRSSSPDKVFAIMRKPAMALPLTFAIIAFFGLRVYDGQISKIKFNRAVLATKQEKDLLKQKCYVLYEYDNEHVASKYKDVNNNLLLRRVHETHQLVIQIFKRLLTISFAIIRYRR